MATLNNSNLITVIIPIYRNSLSKIEQWAVERNLRILDPSRDICVVCPENLDLAPLNDLFGFSQGRCRVERFSPLFFEGRKGYNHLMLSREFYSRFSSSRYILICQTDVALFYDKLDYWCSLGYDYIGAPWLPAIEDVEGKNILRRTIYKLRRAYAKFIGGFHPIMLKYKVGNGGLSLRCVESMLRVINNNEQKLQTIANNSDKTQNFEDVVWSFQVKELFNESLRIPDATTAAHFAIESHPEMALRLTHDELPMGTHAFYRHRNRSFWKKYLDFALE